MREIFGNPEPLACVTERQFDEADQDLTEMSRLPWHEIGPKYWWYYLMDLAYVPLQQDLFDYLFPCFLCTWREGLDLRRSQPESESDFYYAMHKGSVMSKMIGHERRDAIFDWMTDGFCAALDTIKPTEIVARDISNEDLHFFPWTFNALGQSVPILAPILNRLLRDLTPGKCRYWLTIAAGLAWPENETPWISPWTRVIGGGGVYLTESAASIYDSGYLETNLAAYRERVTLDVVRLVLEDATAILTVGDEPEMIELCLARFKSHRAGMEAKFEWYLDSLAKPDLGGVQDELPFFAP
jgi:hypothetical protein